MAPSSSMFSYLRPHHHKRAGSTPNSPDVGSVGSPAVLSPSSDLRQFFEAPPPPLSAGLQSQSHTESPISPYPPILPPIPRVASKVARADRAVASPGSGAGESDSLRSDKSRLGATDARPSQENVREVRREESMAPERSGFAVKRPHTAGGLTGFRSKGQSSSLSPLPPGSSTLDVPSPMSDGRSAVTSPMFGVVARQDSYNVAPSTPGERPSMPTPTPSLYALSTTSQPKAEKAEKKEKKGLHLRNPMSLLLRRRSGQTLEYLKEEALVSQRTPPLPDKDPWIRGTGVHDFSAPRPTRNYSYNNGMATTASMERGPSQQSEDTEVSRISAEDHRPPAVERERAHTPVFREHFDDEADNAARQSRVMAESLANQDFIARNSSQPTFEAPPRPPFARGSRRTSSRQSMPVPVQPVQQQIQQPLQRSIPQLVQQPIQPPAVQEQVQQPLQQEPVKQQPVQQLTEPPPPYEESPSITPPEEKTTVLSPVPEDPPLSPVMESPAFEKETAAESEQTPRRRKASQASSRTRSRALSGSESGLPAHMSSRASRFSFQYGGTDSALQEMMLEEKHKEKEAAKKAKAAAEGKVEDDIQEEDDMYDYDGMDDGDAFGFQEETVPGMEDEDDYFSGGMMQKQVNGYEEDSIPGMEGEDDYLSGGMMQQQVKAHDSFTTPATGAYGQSQEINEAINSNDEVDDHGYDEEAQTLEPKFLYNQNPEEDSEDEEAQTLEPRFLYQLGIPPRLEESSPATGLGLVGLDHGGDDAYSEVLLEPAPVQDDLPPEEPAKQQQRVTFQDDDELYFDDGLIDAANFQDGEFDEEAFDDPSHPLYERKRVVPEQAPTDQSTNAMTNHNSMQAKEAALQAQNSVLQNGPSNGALPFGDMTAYHKALAQAANKAATDGRFHREEGISVQDFSDNDSSPAAHISSRPSLIPDDARISADTSNSMLGYGSGLPDDYESSTGWDDFDCAVEDEEFIAAANAEALANDPDGFYGQEFGFYAAAKGEAQFSYGGYFGDRGVDINRQKSLREPNLTPITERSEYSHRNSFVSVRGHVFGDAGALPSPGLAQLAKMSPYPFDEDEMTLSHLKKLRKSTFGGSDGGRSGKSSPIAWASSPTHGYFAPRGKQAVGASPLPFGWSGNEGSEHYEHPIDPIQEAPDYAEYEPEEDSPCTASEQTRLARLEAERALTRPALSPLQPSPSFSFPSSYSKSRESAASTKNIIVTQPSPDFPPESATASNSTATATPALGAESPGPASPTPWRKGHKRGASGAESVTYVKERQKGSGDYRWVLERRRTAESGELELIGREIVEGGRI